jgi:CRP-like cAMP-binding protein
VLRSPIGNEGTLKACHVLSNLGADLLTALAREAVRVQRSRGDYLWRAGEVASHFTVIASGLIRISRTASDGTETIVALFGPRESIGDVAVLGEKPYPADAVVLTESAEVMRIEAALFRSTAAKHPDLLSAVNTSLTQHALALHQKIHIMSAGKVEKRLSTLLLHLAERFGDQLEDGTTFVPLRLSRTECARMIGTTVETTSRTFSRFLEAGLADTTAEGFALRDLDALRELTSA